MNIQNLLEISTVILGSIGGGALIVFGFSSFLGKVWAKRIADQENQKFEIRFDKIKRENERLSESLKSAQQRYFSKQFELYNDLWQSLINLKISADELWEQAKGGKVKEFAKQVFKTKNSIEQSALLIEDEHYEKLLQIINEFESFKFGKQQLINLRNRNVHMQEFDEHEIKRTIEENGQKREEYTELLKELKPHFKKQIRGENNI